MADIFVEVASYYSFELVLDFVQLVAVDLLVGHKEIPDHLFLVDHFSIVVLQLSKDLPHRPHIDHILILNILFLGAVNRQDIALQLLIIKLAHLLIVKLALQKSILDEGVNVHV